MTFHPLKILYFHEVIILNDLMDAIENIVFATVNK